MRIRQSRRDFLASTSLAAAAGVLGAPGSLAVEGPPEITTIRLRGSTTICFVPVYVVEAFARAEGFTNVQLMTTGLGVAEVQMVEQGDLDFGVNFAGTIVHELGCRLGADGAWRLACGWLRTLCA